MRRGESGQGLQLLESIRRHDVLPTGKAKSLREISDGLACCEGKLNHLGLQEGPKRSTLSYANAKRPWPLFEQVFYDQLGLAQSWSPKRSCASRISS